MSDQPSPVVIDKGADLSALKGPARYGRYYWCIKTKLSKSGEIYVNADDAQVMANGTLAMIRKFNTDGTPQVPMIMLALAAGNWTSFYAASVMDGSAVAVDHWEGEVVR